MKSVNEQLNKSSSDIRQGSPEINKQKSSQPPITRFPHLCWEPLYSVPPLRVAFHSNYDHKAQQFVLDSVRQSKIQQTSHKPTTKNQNQVRDADALVVATLASRHLLQQVRQRTGLQQTQLAHIVSVPWTDIRDLESGARPVTLFVLEKVSRALDTPLTYNSAVSS